MDTSRENPRPGDHAEGAEDPDSTAGADRTAEDTDGQVSEVSAMRAPGEQISPGDSVAGQPDSESGRADEGPTGPDAPTFDERQDRYRDKDDL